MKLGKKTNKHEYCAEYKTMQDFFKSNATTCLHKWKILKLNHFKVYKCYMKLFLCQLKTLAVCFIVVMF